MLSNAIYGHRGWEKGGVLETTFNLEEARQGVPASILYMEGKMGGFTPYMGMSHNIVCGRMSVEKGRNFSNHAPYLRVQDGNTAGIPHLHSERNEIITNMRFMGGKREARKTWWTAKRNHDW